MYLHEERNDQHDQHRPDTGQTVNWGKSSRISPLCQGHDIDITRDNKTKPLYEASRFPLLITSQIDLIALETNKDAK